MAGSAMLPRDPSKLRRLLSANIVRNRTPGVEMAAARRIDRARHVAPQDDPLAFARPRVSDGNRRQKRLCVGVLGVGEQCLAADRFRRCAPDT